MNNSSLMASLFPILNFNNLNPLKNLHVLLKKSKSKAT